MKKLILTMVGVVTAMFVQAQGTVIFQNSASSLVYTNLGGGIRGLASSTTAYDFALFGGAAGVTDSSGFVQFGNVKTGTLPGGANAGLFQGGTRSNTVVAAGSPGSFQVRAWTTLGGVYTTWTAAYNAWVGGTPGMLIGQSTVFDNATGNPTTVPAGTPAAFTGLTSFDMVPVPEPSTIALGMLGLASVMFLRRRSK